MTDRSKRFQEYTKAADQNGDGIAALVLIRGLFAFVTKKIGEVCFTLFMTRENSQSVFSLV